MADEVEVKKTGRRKRPAKKDCINFIDSQFALLQKGIPGYTPEIAVAAIESGDYFLYKNEVEKLLEERLATDETYDASAFVTLLKQANAIQEGAAPRFGESQLVRINSMERALEVANSPEDAEKIAEIMTKMLALRDELNPMINEKSSCSIALKNKKASKSAEDDNKTEGSPEPTVEASE